VDTLKQITTISAEIDARDHDTRQVITLRDTDTLGDLDIGQKHALVCRELERTLGRAQNMADTLLRESVPLCSLHLSPKFVQPQ
jgi:hypothetical protein